MKITRLFALIPLILAASAQFGVARAQPTLTVCASGCSHTTIQGAISHAVDGDTILIEKGHYFEAINTLGKALTLQGVNTRQVIIDANGTGTVVTIPGVNPVTIDNLTITRGYGNGGGISTQGSAPLTIINSVITNNYSTGNGGGIEYEPALSSNSEASGELNINDSTISNNTAVGSGGGANVHMYRGSANIVGVTFARNAASTTQGGGGLYLAGSYMTALVGGARVVDNTEGGGIVAQSDGAQFEVNILESTIAGNNSTGAAFGGGITYNCVNMTLDHDVISQNSAITGGGIYGVNNTSTSCLRTFFSFGLRSTYVLQNSAGTGGGTYILGSVNNGGDVEIKDNQPDNCAKGTTCP
jgi:hypothetical protein